MSWDAIRGHEAPLQQFRREAKAGRLAHAYLFVGPDGIGKRRFAQTLAQARFCPRHTPQDLEPCGACPDCKQVLVGTHPDLIQAGRPEDKHDLPIAVVRQLIAELGLRPVRGRGKVAILDDADLLNAEAANALLKTLEEPPPDAILILVGTSAELQMETILSRCRVVRFEPLANDDVAAILIQRGQAESPEQAHDLASRSEGSVGRALGLADSDLQVFRRQLIDALTDLKGPDPSRIAADLEAHIKDSGKESVAQRARAGLLFGELARFFRATLWQTAGLEPPSPDPQDRIAIDRIAQRLDPEDVLILADRCLQADYHVHRKIYMKIIVDALVTDLTQILNPAR